MIGRYFIARLAFNMMRRRSSGLGFWPSFALGFVVVILLLALFG